MSVEEYWMGKNIDLEAVWRDFELGQGYIAKFSDVDAYLLRLTFAGHPIHQPLFDHEAVYKTVKATFHDVKESFLSPSAYEAASPIFLYRINRGSGVFEFLAQFDPLMTWLAALGGASLWYRKALSDDQRFDADRLEFLKKNFPRAHPADVKAYMKARTTYSRRKILSRLIDQGLSGVEVSADPVTLNSTPDSLRMIDMKPVVPLSSDPDA